MDALFIVERNFLDIHVGVRRVILYYVNLAKKLGYNVIFGTPDSGKIYLGIFEEFESNLAKDYLVPYMSSVREQDHFLIDEIPSVKSFELSWTNEQVNPFKTSVNVVTCPWIVASGLPALPNVIGIVYDLVPNLLAASVIRFPIFHDIFDFAQKHSSGFNYYLFNAFKIICISDNTRNDFNLYYRTANKSARVVTDIPFLMSNSDGCNFKKRKSILLVNALDYRKNIINIEKVIDKAAKMQYFDLHIIGRERIPLQQAVSFFERMSELCVNVRWWRDASDVLLDELYRASSVLLFPSIYEGLGLPILEAQERGLPVISSDASSCVEINLNKHLCFNSSDVHGMSNAINAVLSNTMECASGLELSSKLKSFLETKQLRNDDIFK